jgi:glycosyltransferase involved in cell wall biosynthesis
MLRASVIIPTRNKSRYLALTIASLARQTESRSSFEVLVVDDGSDDDTREIVAKHRADLALNYIRRGHQGRAAARNAAIRVAKGDLLIFCDDDRIAHPSFVADHVAAHVGAGDAVVGGTEAHTHAPSVVLGHQRAILSSWSHDLPIAPADLARLVVRNSDLASKLAAAEAAIVEPDAIHHAFDATVAAFELPETWWERHVGPLVERFGPTLDGFAFPWSASATGNLSAPRALVEQVGMFDESFVGWGLEDTELHLRLWAAGARTRVIERGLNWHQIHPRSPDNAVEWTRNAIRLLDKHPTLEVTLYLRMIRRRLTLDAANRIAHEAMANPTGTRELVRELVRLHREHFEMLVASL